MTKGRGARALPMVGGQGNNSYMHNSAYQRSRYLSVKEMVEEAIHNKFDVPIDKGIIRIADLGCSVGPNTFYAMQTVIDTVLIKIKRLAYHQGEAPQFQVYFSDQTGNDFNMLFGSLPSERRYFVAGVPGSFYSRLFPRASIDYFSSSLALQWLSKAPDGVANKGRVHCYGGGPDILNAYLAQFRADMAAFLNARAEELVPGGLLVLLFLCRHEWMKPDAPRHDLWFAYLEPILREFVCEGKVEEEELDSFQVPIYAPSIDEFKEAVEMNGCFTIHVAQLVDQGWGLKGGGDQESEVDLKQLARSVGIASRAVFERTVSNHFGEDIVVELFQRFSGKVYHHFTSLPSMPSPPPTVFFVLQKKTNSY